MIIICYPKLACWTSVSAIDRNLISLTFVGGYWQRIWGGRGKWIPAAPFLLTLLLALSKSSTEVSPCPSTSPEGGCEERWKCLLQIRNFLLTSLLSLHLPCQMCWEEMVCKSILRQSMTWQLARAEHQYVDRLQINSYTALALVTSRFRRREGRREGKWEENYRKGVLGLF